MCIDRKTMRKERQESFMSLLDVKNVKKIYTTRFGGSQVQALADVTFSIEPREYVAIMGDFAEHSGIFG